MSNLSDPTLLSFILGVGGPSPPVGQLYRGRPPRFVCLPFRAQPEMRSWSPKPEFPSERAPFVAAAFEKEEITFPGDRTSPRNDHLSPLLELLLIPKGRGMSLEALVASVEPHISQISLRVSLSPCSYRVGPWVGALVRWVSKLVRHSAASTSIS